MSYRHTAKRRDANEFVIVDALRAVGATVTRLEQGGGVPDLLVGYQGKTYLLEVKNPEDDMGAKPGGKRTKGRGALTADQVKWFAAWMGSPVTEVINADEALEAIGALRLAGHRLKNPQSAEELHQQLGDGAAAIARSGKR